MENNKLTGIELITKERYRQIEIKGYDDDHDELESGYQLAGAAAMFIANAINLDFQDHTHYDEKGNCARFQIRELHTIKWSEQWPWDDRDGRLTSDIITSLVKAGALIVAEIDRLQNQNK